MLVITFGILLLIISLIIYKKFQALIKQIDKLKQENKEQIEIIEKNNYILEFAKEAGDIGMWSWDFNTKYLEWDYKMYELFDIDYSIDDNLFDEWKTMFSKSDQEKLNNLFWLNSENNLDTIIKIIKQDTQIVNYIKVIGNIVFDENANPIYIIGISQNITHLVDAKLKAEKISLSKSQFLANMSHEIRTPLNGIIGLNDLLLNTELTIKQKDYLLKSKISSKALLNLINDILDYSKIEAQKLEIIQEPFSLNTILSNISALFSTTISSKGLDFYFKIDPNIPLVLIGDSLRLTQILNNLIGNSIKFTQDGYILIEIYILKQDTETVELKFDIKDTGIGISKIKQSKLFNAFEQGDKITAKQYGGTGLGLAISKQLVELMDGNISLVSKRYKGSKFSIVLKFAYEHFKPPTINCNNALIIENKSINQKYLEEILKTWGSKSTLITDSVTKGIKLVENKLFDYIFIDYDIENEKYFLEQINLLSKDKENTKIILIIQNSKRDMILQLITENNLDIYNIIEQPFTPFNLLHVLQNSLSNKDNNQHYLVLKNEKQALLVEDNDINQTVATKFLERLNFNVDIANHGKEALHLIKQKQNYDIIFMDLQMPIMDGYKATEKIRVLNKNIPIIAISALSSKSDIKKALDIGMNAHIIKPINNQELIDIVSKYFTLIEKESDEYLNISSTQDISKIIDLDGVEQTLRINKQKLYYLYKVFFDDFSNINDILKSKNHKDFRSYIHKLKSNSGHLKINNVAPIAKKIHDSDYIIENDINILKKELKKALKMIEIDILPLIQEVKKMDKIELKDTIFKIIEEFKEYKPIESEKIYVILQNLRYYNIDNVTIQNVKTYSDTGDRTNLIKILKYVTEDCL